MKTGMLRGVGVVVALAIAAITGLGSVSAQTVSTKDKDGSNVAVVVKPVLVQGAASTMTYTITAVNYGESRVKNATITVPLDPDAQRVVDVQRTVGESWISGNAPEALELQTGPIASNDEVAFTVQLAAQPGAQQVGLGQRVSVRWVAATRSGGSGTQVSNLPTTAFVGQAGNDQLYRLNAAFAGNRVTLTSGVFVPDEPVVVWYNTSNGGVIDTEIKRNEIVDADKTDDDEAGADYAIANQNGQIDLFVDTNELAPGTYSIVAQGARSGLTAVTSFEVR